MERQITAEDRARVMRMVMATIELVIRQELQDAFVRLARQGLPGQLELAESVRSAAANMNNELASYPAIRAHSVASA